MIYELEIIKSKRKVTAVLKEISGEKTRILPFPMNNTIKGIILGIAYVDYRFKKKFEKLLIRISSGRTYCYINDERLYWSNAHYYDIKDDLEFLLDIMCIVIDLSN